MNSLLLNTDRSKCEAFLSYLGHPASLARVLPDGRFTVIANNRLQAEYYGGLEIGEETPLDAEHIGEILGRHPDEIRPDIEQLHARYRIVVESRQPLIAESSYVDPDGLTRTSHNHIIPVIDDSGQVARILVTMTEVTSLHEAREVLENSLADIMEAANVKVCRQCHKVSEGDDWETLSSFMQRHTDLVFSHGLCASCHEQHFGEYHDAG